MPEDINKLINELNELYAQNNLIQCKVSLLLIAIYYNSIIEEQSEYNHDFKKILLRIDFIKNPLGYKYTPNDYNNTNEILYCVIEQLISINAKDNEELNSIFNQDLLISEHIICDVLELITYLELLYSMSNKNAKHIDSCSFSKLPFAEQIFNLILFYQNQIRLVKENYSSFCDKSGITGLELSLSNRKVDGTIDGEGSVSDSFELMLEGINELIRYLFYKNKKDFKEKFLFQILTRV